MDPETRAYYDGNSRGYSDSTMGNDLSDTMSRFLGHMRQGGRILDLGCGSGRDTKTLMSKGYDVVPVDGSEGMCRVASENLGMPVRRLDFSDLDYVKEFDGVWACASLLHVPSAELPRTIMLIHRSLRSDGVLFANFKEGVYGGMRDGRHYTDMTEGRLAELLDSKGMVPIEIWTSVDPRGVRWTNSVSRKARSLPHR